MFVLSEQEGERPGTSPKHPQGKQEQLRAPHRLSVGLTAAGSPRDLGPFTPSSPGFLPSLRATLWFQTPTRTRVRRCSLRWLISCFVQRCFHREIEPLVLVEPDSTGRAGRQKCVAKAESGAGSWEWEGGTHAFLEDDFLKVRKLCWFWYQTRGQMFLAFDL